MTYEMQLPARVTEIDTEIQTLEMLQQGFEGLQAMRASLDEAREVFGRMSDAVGGETLSASDIIDIKPDPETGDWTVSIDTEKIDPLTLDKASVPANLAKEAIRAQQALEEIAKPFADHQSKLLKSLEKLSSGLDRASDLFASTQKAIDTLDKAWDLFDRAMAGDISADELIDAFDTYFSTVIEVLADTIGKVPGLGAFLEIYAKAIKSIVPDLKLISASQAHKNAVIASVFNDAPPPPVDSELTDVITEQQESLAAQIDALTHERMDLLSEHEAEQARRAVLEVDQLEKLAERKVEESTGYRFDTVADITFSMQNALWIGWPSQIEALLANDPDDPRIGEIQEKIETTTPKLREALGTRYRMEAAKVEEIERMIREHPEVLSPADLLELQNRYPQLGDAISDIRAGNPLGTETFEQIEARTAAAAAVLDAEHESAEEDDADDFSPTDGEHDDVPVAAAAGGMSPGTKKVVIFGGGGLLAGALMISAILILPLGTGTDTAASTSSTAAQQEPATEQVTSSTAAATTSSSTPPPTATAEEAMGDSADPPSGAEENPATTVREFGVTQGSLVFSVAVNGDGRAMAESEDTKWYQAIFTFDTAEGAYEIRGTWKRGKEMEGDVFDETFTKLDDAVVVGEWTESDSFVITASDYGSDEVPSAVRLDILVRIDGGDDADTDYGDQVLWESSG